MYAFVPMPVPVFVCLFVSCLFALMSVSTGFVSVSLYVAVMCMCISIACLQFSLSVHV